MNFYHSGSMGDIIYSLPTIMTLGGGSLFIKKEQQFNTLCALIELQPHIIKVVHGHTGTSLNGFRIPERKAFKEHGGKKHLQHIALNTIQLPIVHTVRATGGLRFLHHNNSHLNDALAMQR